MRKTKKKEILSETIVGQLEIFIGKAKFAKVSAAFGGVGIFKEDLIKDGISEKTFKWLIEHRYISYHEEKPLWIANTNKLHPDRTITNLEKMLKDYKDFKKK